MHHNKYKHAHTQQPVVLPKFQFSLAIPPESRYLVYYLLEVPAAQL